KKHSSPNKQNRSNIAGTLKRNPKYELKKDELIQLLGRFEAELQAKDIALAALKVTHTGCFRHTKIKDRNTH
ncbi:unnamed protein product, partial [Rotaria socialis]